MDPIEPFKAFLARTAAARHEQYPEVTATELERMKAYIRDYYEGVRPTSSYADAGGHAVDCVPFEQQPTARAAIAAGHKLPTAPPLLSLPGGTHRVEHEKAHGPCAPGSIALPRITLEQLVRAGTLENFFRKGPAPG
jgi:hypothetical protein